jgi:hypothetical protein
MQGIYCLYAATKIKRKAKKAQNIIQHGQFACRTLLHQWRLSRPGRCLVRLYKTYVGKCSSEAGPPRAWRGPGANFFRGPYFKIFSGKYFSDNNPPVDNFLGKKIFRTSTLKFTYSPIATPSWIMMHYGLSRVKIRIQKPLMSYWDTIW